MHSTHGGTSDWYLSLVPSTYLVHLLCDAYPLQSAGSSTCRARGAARADEAGAVKTGRAVARTRPALQPLITALRQCRAGGDDAIPAWKIADVQHLSLES